MSATSTRNAPTSKAVPRHAEGLERFAWLMDRAFSIPGTNIKIGLDALIGLLPFGGDAITGLLQAGLVLVAINKYQVPKAVAGKMIANVLMDTLIGSDPPSWRPLRHQLQGQHAQRSAPERAHGASGPGDRVDGRGDPFPQVPRIRSEFLWLGVTQQALAGRNGGGIRADACPVDRGFGGPVPLDDREAFGASARLICFALVGTDGGPCPPYKKRQPASHTSSAIASPVSTSRMGWPSGVGNRSPGLMPRRVKTVAARSEGVTGLSAGVSA